MGKKKEIGGWGSEFFDLGICATDLSLKAAGMLLGGAITTLAGAFKALEGTEAFQSVAGNISRRSDQKIFLNEADSNPRHETWRSILRGEPQDYIDAEFHVIGDDGSYVEYPKSVIDEARKVPSEMDAGVALEFATYAMLTTAYRLANPVIGADSDETRQEAVLLGKTVDMLADIYEEDSAIVKNHAIACEIVQTLSRVPVDELSNVPVVSSSLAPLYVTYQDSLVSPFRPKNEGNTTAHPFHM